MFFPIVNTFLQPVCNKETNEKMHSRNTGSGLDSNLEFPDERQIPQSLSKREFSQTQSLGIVFKSR